MQLIALGAVALLLIVWMSGGRTVFQRREWRITSGVFALAAFVGAAYTVLREAWLASAALTLLGLWLAVSARKTAPAAARPRPAEAKSGRMSLKEARSILGVGSDATAADIRAAHKRLMRMAHPDKGGTTGLAAQLNAARDRLLQEK